MEANVRSLDVAQVASTDLVALNNTVVNMRSIVKSAKVQVIHKLTRYIQKLKAKRGSDTEKQKNLRKAERMLEEVFAIKALKADKVSKFALANTSSFEDICKQPTTGTELRCLARLAEHKQLSKKVADFRDQHADWPALTAYLMVKQTGRRFKTKKQKEATKKTSQANITAARSVTHSYLTNKLGASEKIDRLLTGPRQRKGGKEGQENAINRGLDMATTVEKEEEEDSALGNSAVSNAANNQRQARVPADEIETNKNVTESVAAQSEDSDGGDDRDEVDESSDEDSSSDNNSAEQPDADTSKPWLDMSDGEDSGNGVVLDKNSDASESCGENDDRTDSEEVNSDDDVVDEASDGDAEENKSSGDEGSSGDNEDNKNSDDEDNSDDDDEGSCDDETQNHDLKRRALQKMRETKRKGVSKANSTKVPIPGPKKNRTQMVVKRIDLNSAESNEIFADSPSSAVPDILLENAPSKSRMAKDPFFLGSEGDSDDDFPGNDESFLGSRKTQRDNASDDDSPQQHEQRRLQSGLHAMESAFLDSLDSRNVNRNRSFNNFEKRGRGSQSWNARGKRFERADHGRESFRGRASGFSRERSWGNQEGDYHRQSRDSNRGSWGRGQRGGFRGRGRGGYDRDGGRGQDSSRGQRRESNGHAFKHGNNRDAKAPSRTAIAGDKKDEQVHPSWAASQKRKLQEQTTSFQGKRIKFDD